LIFAKVTVSDLQFLSAPSKWYQC